MKFKKLRKSILSTNRITLDITNNGKYLGYKSYETIFVSILGIKILVESKILVAGTSSKVWFSA